MAKEIRRISAIIYSKSDRGAKFSDVTRFRFFKKSKLKSYIATKFAARLKEPLDRFTLDAAVKEFNLSIKHCKDQQRFSRILERNAKAAYFSWSNATIAVLRRQSAYLKDHYSYEGTLYLLEKTAKGPLSKERKEEWRLASSKIEDLNKQLEELTLEELAEQNPNEYARYTEELGVARLRLEITTERENRENREVQDILNDIEEELLDLISR